MFPSSVIIAIIIINSIIVMIAKLIWSGCLFDNLVCAEDELCSDGQSPSHDVHDDDDDDDDDDDGDDDDDDFFCKQVDR